MLDPCLEPQARLRERDLRTLDGGVGGERESPGQPGRRQATTQRPQVHLARIDLAGDTGRGRGRRVQHEAGGQRARARQAHAQPVEPQPRRRAIPL
ncbi:MAG: hypothetical protein ACK559_03445, partial [bacterium]